VTIFTLLSFIQKESMLRIKKENRTIRRSEMAVSSDTIIKFSGRKVQSLYLAFIGAFLILPSIPSQIFVGTTVNCVLFLSVGIFGLRRTLFLGMIPSFVALLFGHLLIHCLFFPIAIILGNSLLVALYAHFTHFRGMLAASLGKFLLIFTAFLLMGSLDSSYFDLWKVVLLQPLTAILGGILALYLQKK
jgi:hypothetical protein